MFGETAFHGWAGTSWGRDGGGTESVLDGPAAGTGRGGKGRELLQRGHAVRSVVTVGARGP